MAKINFYVIFGFVVLLLLSVFSLSKQAVHNLYELLAIPFGIFFIWYGLVVAKGFYRYVFIVFGFGNLVVDGYLLLRNLGVLNG